MSFTKITPIDITPGSAGSWVSTALDSYIPVGSTGVVVRAKVTSADTNYMIRHGDSTDTIFPESLQNTMQWGFCGVNSSREIDIKVDSTSQVTIELYGYFNDKASFFTNAVNKTPGTSGSFQDVTIASDTGADTAIAALCFWDSDGSTTVKCLRKNGSSQDLKESAKGSLWDITGCDESEIFEAYTSHTSTTQDLFLVGYLTDGVVMHDDMVDRSLGSTGSWADLTALGSGATAGIYWVRDASGGSDNNFGLRENGSSDTVEGIVSDLALGIIPCDGSLLVEGKISNTDVDFHEKGYFISGTLFGSPDDLHFGFGSSFNESAFGGAGF